MPDEVRSSTMTDAIHDRLLNEAADAHGWSNGPGFRYATHTHPFTKILYCTEGSIDFFVDSDRRTIHLEAGDRMELPAGTPHSAVVGPHGVTCIEGKRR
jgi:quercetin dioxygenase-like cupin family protein